MTHKTKEIVIVAAQSAILVGSLAISGGIALTVVHFLSKWW